MKYLPFENINKIAVVRANALGDFIFCLPALDALRKTYPDAKIYYLGKSWHKGFVDSHNKLPIDELVVIPPTRGVGESNDFIQDDHELDSFFTKIQLENFDLAVQLHGGGRFSNPFTKRLRARISIGSKASDAPPLDHYINFNYYHNEILRNLEVVALAGAYTDQIEAELIPSTYDVTEAKKLIEEFDSPIVVLHPGASAVQRRWPIENFAEIGDFVAAKGYSVFITGDKNEYELGKKLSGLMRYQPKLLSGKISLGELTGILSLASVVISNDTGPLHLARALGTSTIGIYWCGNLINAGPIRTDRHKSLTSWIIKCPLCGQDCTKDFPFEHQECKHTVSFVSDVKVAEVKNSLVDLLGRNQSKQQRVQNLNAINFLLDDSLL